MTIKVVELIGCSKENFGEAVEKAVERASKTVRSVTGVDVIKFSAKVENGAIVEYCANVKVAFVVEGTE